MHPFMSPMAQMMTNDADVTNELRSRALKRTAEMLRELDTVRRALELPVEHLPIVIETYAKVIRALIAESQCEDLAKRMSRIPITIRSETSDYQPMKIRPGKSIEVIVRPQVSTFCPEDFAIHGDRSRWLVHDIKIGNRSQFGSKRGPAPGTEFGPARLAVQTRPRDVGGHGHALRTPSDDPPRSTHRTASQREAAT